MKAITNTRKRSEIARDGEFKILRKLSTVTSILARTWTKIFQFWEREREREREMVDGDDIVTSEGGMIKLGCASLFSVRARERASER